MVRKSDGEKIDELMIAVATLDERMNRIDDKVQGLKDEVQELKQVPLLLSAYSASVESSISPPMTLASMRPTRLIW